ncbi:MAG: hypothetical protein HC845_09200 [Akkermansiaceae bacterium]|nr:hypothetical protein [Akkermansiaceae bacterium]
MSPREKKLLIFFGLAGFLVLNFLGVNWALAKQRVVKNQKVEAKTKLEVAENFRNSSAEITDQMEWLAQNEPQPASNQDVQTKLQQLADREARQAGLTIKSQKPLPTETTGTHYHRASFQFVLNGMEDALYRWFDKVNIPEQFRVASQINMKPNAQDDTKIDCTVTISQWFIPTPAE